MGTCLCSNLTLAASLSSASSLVLQPANSLTFELIMGANLTFAGFAIHAMSPATNVPPQTSNYTHGWTWSVQGLTIHGLFGTVLPYIVEFSSSLEDAPQANSSLLLKDMVINYTSCGQAWPTVAAIIAQPPGVRQSLSHVAGPVHPFANAHSVLCCHHAVSGMSLSGRSTQPGRMQLASAQEVCMPIYAAATAGAVQLCRLQT